jgi:clan AA aspartic protease
MISGRVTDNLEAVIPVAIRGPTGLERSIDAVIDTGFNAFLTLPAEIVKSLGLAAAERGRAILADGETVLFDIYDALVVWDGIPREIKVSEAETAPLLGTAILAGYNLSIDVIAGGSVTIGPLVSRE